MIGVDIFISCGDEVATYRDVGQAVFRSLEHMFRNELEVPLAIANWDFRADAPRVVRAGDLAARSLAMVERSNALIAIFGADLPKITCKEIRRAFSLRQRGSPVDIWVFLDRGNRSRRHAEFVARIKRQFHEEIIFTLYESELDFQAKLFTTLTPYLFRRFMQAPVVLGETA